MQLTTVYIYVGLLIVYKTEPQYFTDYDTVYTTHCNLPSAPIWPPLSRLKSSWLHPLISYMYSKFLKDFHCLYMYHRCPLCWCKSAGNGATQGIYYFWGYTRNLLFLGLHIAGLHKEFTIFRATQGIYHFWGYTRNLPFWGLHIAGLHKEFTIFGATHRLITSKIGMI